MMPNFFFDTEINGQRLRDDEGLPFPDLQTAKREATVALYGIASEVEPPASAVHALLRVRDDADDTVLVLDMRLTISSPETGGSLPRGS